MHWWRRLTRRRGEVRPGEELGGGKGVRLADDVAQDVRFAFRSLAKQQGFVMAALLTLGLGIGANVAMFSVVNLALFQALPFPDSDRLVLGRTLWPGGSIGWTVSAPDYYDVRDEASSFASLAAITPFGNQFTVTGGGEPERITGAWISPGFFHALGVLPQLGREFLAEEGEPGGERVVMLSHEFWQRRFGGDPGVIGSAVVVDGTPQTIVGVGPSDFEFVVDADAWAPMVRGEAYSTARQFHNWLVVGRLRSNVTLAAARAEVDLIMRRLADTYPESNRDKGLVLAGMQEAFVENFRPTLLMLMGAIALVLLIACGNVASLMLARGAARRTEMAMRSALGAGGGRLVRQLLTESAVLGLAAGTLGTVIAVSLQRSLVASTPLTRLGLDAAGLQAEVLVFALALSLATVLLFGLAPALSAARVDPAEDLKAGARSVVAGGTRFRNGLVIVQVALSIILLVGAGLLLRSFVLLRGVDPGFESENVLTAEIGLPRAQYETGESRLQFFDELAERVRAIPGVRNVGLISRLPIRDPGNNVAVWDPANPPADASEWRLAFQRIVMPGYFEALGIPIREGRDVQATDVPGGPPVVVISETMARTLFPDRNPLGRQVAIDTGGEPALLGVVGVVGDVQASSLDSDISMVMYFAYPQRAARSMRIAVRTAAAPGSVVRPLRSILRELDPDIPLAGVATMEEVLSRSVSFTRTVMSALGLFAGFALFLAALGLYGVLAYYVAQRNREIGIRMALGATGRDVFGMVLSRGFALVGLGLVIGIGGAIGAARLIQTLLFEVEATDPATFVSICLFFALVALVACLIPAWRAWRVDPVVAFRSE
ncbi:MAG: ABC transporter permease [Gemmatimonadota bacterium]|nr:MAG: ABC transporter permease [Gemmatimonadota bacterium]